MHLLGSLPRATLALALLLCCAPSCGAAPSDAQSAVPLATATPDEQAEEPATLEILAVPPADVKIDGKSAGKTPIKAYKVSAGQHDVTFTDDTGPRTMSVSVEAGEARVVKSDRAPGIIEKKR